MAKDHTNTVQIRKVDKVAPDHRGRTVWLSKIEPVELELGSTMALQKILKTGGGETRRDRQARRGPQEWCACARRGDGTLPHPKRGGPQ